jgi:toxin-antitoxin system PIN domain toxin
MRNSAIDLLDVNVWVALSDADHVHFERASRYWSDEAQDMVAFCRITALALLRLTTNRHVMSGRPFTCAQAWASYRQFRELSNVLMLAEPAELENKMAEWSDLNAFPEHRWTDCAVAAWAALCGCRVVSFDSDFGHFPGIDVLHLQTL